QSLTILRDRDVKLLTVLAHSLGGLTMNDRESRRIQMFVRVDTFGDAHIDDFVANSVGRTLFVDLKSVIAELNAHAAAEVAGRGSARQETDMCAESRRELREDLEAIY